MYLPLHNVSRKRYVFKISIYNLCCFTSTLPLLAFFTCVFITMYKDFEKANHTHCDVPNIFPSISASVGSYEPQMTIWQTAIYLHAPLRFFVIFLRSQYYHSIIKDNFYILVRLAVILNIFENLALLGLTHWSSSHYYPYHEFCFKAFIGTSLIYMFLICMMLYKCRRRPNITDMENYSLKLKWKSFITNIGSFSLAAYCFLRHNRLCEPYVYSMFGISEYVIVVSNITFHFSTVYDLHIKYIYLTSKGLAIE